MSLDALRDADGWFRILAIDHRDSLRAFLAPHDPDSVDAATLTAIKIDLARAVLPFATGVMLEPEYSIPQLLEAGVVPAGVGFIAALEAQGYERSALAGFNVAASEGSLAFGGPDTAHTVPQLITGRLAYLQYQQPETQDCVLVFAHDAGQGFTVIATIAVAQLNARLSGLLTPQDDLQTTLICSPLGWGDLNGNGRPDLAVSLMWANHLTGSEVHLFEVADDLTVTDLVADLPGIVSPWAFDPAEDVLTVFDLDWAGHDCLYPPLAVAWVYGWRAGRYVDVMAERDFSGYLQSLEDAVRAGFGAPFNPYLAIGPLTQLLAVSERIGERRAGWQRYTTLSDLANFPGTDAESAAWLKSDVAHFARAMQTGAPFTPNDFCSGP